LCVSEFATDYEIGSEMIYYFILFTVAGFIGGIFLSKRAINIAIIIGAISWATVYGPFWALVSLAEMYFGYFLCKTLRV
jgi:hypothetical protein